MQRRRLTLKRIDPWTVLKFGGIVNACLYVIVLVGFGILWFFVGQLGLVEKACDVATRVGAVECSVTGSGIFRSLVILGLLGAIVQTGLFVLSAFLYNTIAEIAGGLQVTVLEDAAGTPSPKVSVASPREQPESRPVRPPPIGSEKPHEPAKAPTPTP